jgi:hypothetical protein
MNRDLARQLLLLVNDKEMMDRLQSYAAARIEGLRGQLEISKDHERIREIQGSIQELRRFATLRDEAIRGAE